MAAVAAVIIVTFLFVSSRSADKKPAETKFVHQPEKRSITAVMAVAHLPNRLILPTFALKIERDTFDFQYNKDSTLMEKKWFRHKEYWVQAKVVDPVTKKDTILVAPLPNEFVLDDWNVDYSRQIKIEKP